MNERDLERYARHLSLPAIGLSGQERLLATAVRVDPAFPDLARALERMGLRLDAAAGLSVEPDELLPPGQVSFDGNVYVGPRLFSHAEARESSAPLHMKQRFFDTLVASELVLWLLGRRPPRYVLSIDFPSYAIHV